jgi:hypothetical protein
MIDEESNVTTPRDGAFKSPPLNRLQPGAVSIRDLIEGTWLHTWRWPGVAFFLFVGICPALVAAATLRRMHRPAERPPPRPGPVDAEEDPLDHWRHRGSILRNFDVV